MSDNNKYNLTLLLPKTDFGMRGKLPTEEVKMMGFWNKIELWKKLREKSKEREKFVDYRNRLNSGESILEKMCLMESLTLATDRLAYLAHWITPKIEKRRYTTRFFVAIAPSGQEGFHDGSESVNSLWIKPEEALKQQEEGKLLLIMPTIKNLQSICGYSNVEELLNDKCSIDPSTIPTIEPKFFMEDGKMVGLLPGDEGYEDH